MAAVHAADLEQLRDQADIDPDFAETLAYLARWAREAGKLGEDPAARPAPAVLRSAQEVARRRDAAQREEFVRHAFDTATVVALIAAINDRRGVDRRRARGHLLGMTVGRTTYHPAWQFDRARRETYDGLDDVLAALAEVTDDPVTADRIVRLPRPELDGGSVASLLALGETATAVRLVRQRDARL